MTPQAYTPRTAPAPRRRALLLAGSALCGAASMWASGAMAQVAFGSSTFSTGGAAPNIAQTNTASNTTVTLNADRTIVNWNTFTVAPGQVVDFSFAVPATVGNPAVLNVSPTIDISGIINQKAGSLNTGDIWFFSNGTIVLKSGSNVTSGGALVFASPGGVDFRNGATVGSFQAYRGPPSQARVDTDAVPA